MTATDVRDNREKEARALDVRKHVGVRMRVARGLVSLGNRDYREAGREMGEVGEEGGLGEWDGLVSRFFFIRRSCFSGAISRTSHG